MSLAVICRWTTNLFISTLIYIYTYIPCQCQCLSNGFIWRKAENAPPIFTKLILHLKNTLQSINTWGRRVNRIQRQKLALVISPTLGSYNGVSWYKPCSSQLTFCIISMYNINKQESPPIGGAVRNAKSLIPQRLSATILAIASSENVRVWPCIDKHGRVHRDNNTTQAIYV